VSNLLISLDIYLILFNRLFLVLIKSKQEELKNVQTLDLFQRVVDTMDITNFEQMPPLMPKQLIQQYQLNKSQLAFTICTLDPTGANCVPDWNTTIYSSILTGKKSILSLVFFN
jgi:hypothetical protein